MRATFCDRCGSKVGGGGGTLEVVEALREKGLAGVYDLCDICLIMLGSFLNLGVTK